MSGKKALPRRCLLGELRSHCWVRDKENALVVDWFNDIINEMSDVIIVAPITSTVKKVYSSEVKSRIGKKLGKIMLHQCRSIDKSRIETKLDHLDFDVMNLVDDAIRVAFGLS